MRRAILASLFFAFATLPLFAAVPPKPSEAELREWMRDAFAKAAGVPEANRRALERELVTQESSEDRDEAIRDALFTIALRPRDARSAVNLLHAVAKNRQPGVYILNREESGADTAAAKAFLFDLYRKHADKTAEGIGWQAGLAELLMYDGKFEEALKLDRETVSIVDEPQYVRVRLAMLEMVAGDPAPFAKVIAECDPPAEYSGMTENYCGTVARSIASRAKMRLGAKTPKAIEDILAGRAGMESLPWPERMHGLTSLAQADFRRAKQDLRAVLAASDAPSFVKNDAILLLAQIAANNEAKPAEALSLYDCWIARRGVVLPQLPADGWQKLAALPTGESDEAFRATMEGEGCMDHDFGEERPVFPEGDCVLPLLFRRLNSALQSQNSAVARQSIEQAAAIVLATERPTSIVGMMLNYYAFSGLSDQKLIPVLVRVAYNLGFRDHESEVSDKILREATGRVIEPWPSPTKVSAPDAACP